MSFWQKTMLWLGLGPDEMYEGLADVNHTRTWPDQQVERKTEVSTPGSKIKAKVGAVVSDRQSVETTGTVRKLRPARATTPKTVEPKAFNDVTNFADSYVSGDAVLVKLKGVDHPTARRIIDFASGLCYAEKGVMQRMGSQEYLLIPKDVTVDSETREKIKEEINYDPQD